MERTRTSGVITPSAQRLRGDRDYNALTYRAIPASAIVGLPSGGARFVLTLTCRRRSSERLGGATILSRTGLSMNVVFDGT